MEHFERLFGILLVLQHERAVSAAQLARRFTVSSRTIYRDLQTLSRLGVPLYTTRGHGGGVRLQEGYFLPPLTFSRGEALALLIGLTLLQSLQTFPFPTEVQTATQKLLVAVPAPLRAVLLHLEQLIGFEHLQNDLFHPEPPIASPTEQGASTSLVLTTFVQAILDHARVQIQYASPYRSSHEQQLTAYPLGVFWDRNHWYLVGKSQEHEDTTHVWRADRVNALHTLSPAKEATTTTPFAIQQMIGHRWLQAAMEQWQRTAPVVIRLTRMQAQRLQQDWYYRYASFSKDTHDMLTMTFGEDNQAIVMDLLRWLGPGAELLEPHAWRTHLRAELQQMLSLYDA